eukprot:NODE_28139_length_488_cov_0.952909.p3 GENE.NODE_28139_length_488_cov_0.952909~~NODE_28139_length_488_cov_0.952909.p3  ORF type:complete len:69 (+),score=22.07 NODE_28139_length_488_cov_0.952909:133-339(+)
MANGVMSEPPSRLSDRVRGSGGGRPSALAVPFVRSVRQIAEPERLGGVGGEGKKKKKKKKKESGGAGP